MAAERMILDHLDNIGFSNPTGIDGALNVRGALHLRDGMQFLAKTMRDFELDACQCFGIDKYRKIEFVGKGFAGKTFDPLISCVFHWYSVSLVNYLRFIAMIQTTEQSGLSIKDLIEIESGPDVKKSCNAYLKHVAPEVKKWRNKVSAHFSATDARSIDDVSMLSASLHGYPQFDRGYFKMGPPGGLTTTLPTWSVTQVHEKLASRLWPEMILQPLP